MSEKTVVGAVLPLSLLFGLLLFGCADDAPSESMAELEPGADGAPGIAQAEVAQIMADWCKVKSGRDEQNCACILDAVRGELAEADLAVIAEIADADLAGESNEEDIEAGFNEKFGAERMLSVTQAFVEARASGEASCSKPDRGSPDEEEA